jgi:spore coat polysaccharide biosynthesis protein SpsF
MNQEEFWSSDFGNAYSERNASPSLLKSNINFFEKIFQHVTPTPRSILEIGANIGMNIRAIQSLIPQTNFTAVEINKKACEELKKTGSKVVNIPISQMDFEEQFDLVLSKTVLIHINPEEISQIYEKIYRATNKWILLAEYYNPTPIEVLYRGFEGKLFKRDFAGEMLAKFPSLELVKYGFVYHLGTYPQDDISWFLLKKSEQVSDVPISENFTKGQWVN